MMIFFFFQGIGVRVFSELGGQCSGHAAGPPSFSHDPRTRTAGNLVLTASQSVSGPALFIILTFNYTGHVFPVQELCPIWSLTATWLPLTKVWSVFGQYFSLSLGVDIIGAFLDNVRCEVFMTPKQPPRLRVQRESSGNGPDRVGTDPDFLSWRIACSS